MNPQGCVGKEFIWTKNETAHPGNSDSASQERSETVSKALSL